MKPFSEMTIALASDHAGFALKQQVQLFLEDNGARVKDFGCSSTESCDYPDFAHPLAEAVERGEYEFGIIICSTGNGICMSANKHQGIRAALCWDTKLAELARQHNNANVLGLPANLQIFTMLASMFMSKLVRNLISIRWALVMLAFMK